MAIVCFDKILQITRDQTSEIAGGFGAVGPTNQTSRPTLYDPDWGYFIFGQSVSFEYNEANAYQPAATFTIKGVFTHNASGTTLSSDDTSMTTLVGKFLALSAMLQAKAMAAAPDDISQWGSADDLRTVVLPLPLVDKDGNRIRAIPTEIRAEKGQFANEVAYSATLTEARVPAAKLIINDVIVDHGVITITLPSPEMARHELVGTSGEVLQILHYKTMEVDVAGTLPLTEQDQIATDAAAELADSLASGELALRLATSLSGTVSVGDLWQGLAITDQPVVDLDYANAIAAVSVRARE
jgi:hypothetical protein